MTCSYMTAGSPTASVAFRRRTNLSGSVKNCQPFLVAEIEAMKNLRVILALGGIAHNTLLIDAGRTACQL